MAFEASKMSGSSASGPTLLTSPAPMPEGKRLKTTENGAAPSPKPMVPNLQPVKRFVVGDPEAKTHLEEYGYVVFGGALSSTECDQALDHLWGYLESWGMDRNREETWQAWPPTPGGGLIHQAGMGQSRFMWYCRTRPAVAAAFAQIWSEEPENMITSFDGCAVFRPLTRHPEWRTGDGRWFHVDQHPSNKGSTTVQGLVNLLPVTAASGGNTLVPKSHLSFDDLEDKYPELVANLKSELFMIPKDDPVLEDHMSPLLEPGDLLLWDSRTIHCNCPGTGDGEEAKLLRAASLITMVPRSKATEEVLEKRREACRSAMTLTHMPEAFWRVAGPYDPDQGLASSPWTCAPPECFDERTEAELQLVG